MNRIFSAIMMYTLLITGSACGQNVGIGTPKPDSSAALDISSTNKGLLVPRINLATAGIAAPAAGLMVFNTNAAFGGGTGLYINMGTAAAPQWMQLVPNTSGTFIRNQSATQSNSNFNISGSGNIGQNLNVGTLLTAAAAGVSGSSPIPLTVQSSHPESTGVRIVSSQTPDGAWDMNVLGPTSASPASFALFNPLTFQTPIIATGNGSVGINRSTTPQATLDVNGSIRASGDLIIGVRTVTREFNIPGNTRSNFTLTCPTGYQPLGGGGGHRDFNSGANDISISYIGLDPANPLTTWRLMCKNSGSSSHVLVMYCNCAKVK